MMQSNQSTRDPQLKQQRPDDHKSDVGALVLGGDYRALGMVRSLGRHQIPVWVVNGEHRLSASSRYARRTFSWPTEDNCGRLEFLIDLCRQNNLKGWVVFPSSDQSASLLAQHYDLLSDYFSISSPCWEMFRWFDDKRLTYQLAADLGIDHPATYCPNCREELPSLDISYPAILKPAVKEQINQFTHAKAWRVDDLTQLLSHYDLASEYVDPRQILIQELLPGGSQDQFSFAALCQDGRPLASISARRGRQFPIDFGWSSSFVETVDRPEVEALSRRLLSAIDFTGLVEVEFKYDRRDGRYKLLDVNPRIWGWHTLGQRAGIDFTYLLWRMIRGEEVPEVRSRRDVRWVRGAMDVRAVIAEMRDGRLSAKEYFHSLRPPIEFAIVALDDPLPGILELPFLARLYLKRRRQLSV